ncbi:hypothetical protein LJK88_47160 [Paenibacillus sp. P26]|nr:hypothetical protein LJK88_47160 [Paenibacillus sp. P26]UUZ91847.1 hypothetical protein LJK87_41150 [Paenibacillus sp. P25]
MGRLQDTLTPVWKRMCGGRHLNRSTDELVREAGFRITRVEGKYKRIFLILEAVNEK